jgi:sirohydrochlorin ferrochelatase
MPNISMDAYVLVAHGSRDARPQLALTHLAHQLTQYLLEQTIGQTTAPFIRTACLELASEPLHQQLLTIAAAAVQTGRSRLCILPLFLLPGVHVMEDIPAEVAIAAQKLTLSHGDAIGLELLPYLGQHPNLAQLLGIQQSGIEQVSSPGAVARILLAHGSKRPGGNQLVEMLAHKLAAVTAYWSTPPSLELQVEQLAQQGYDRIAILPYFLFAGSTTDAIAQQVAQLGEKYPTVQFCLAEVIAAQPAFIGLLAPWLTSAIAEVPVNI